MITVEEVNEECKGKTVEKMHRFCDEGFVYTRITFTDGSTVEISEDFVAPPPVVQPQPKEEDPICDVCRERDSNVAKDRRNLAVGTLQLMCQALELKDSEKKTFEDQNSKVRDHAREVIRENMTRKIAAKKRAEAARPARKEAKKQEKYGKGGN
jgi:hypothetical protein